MAQNPTPDDVAPALFRAFAVIAYRVRQLRTPGQLTLPERAVLARIDGEGPASGAYLARAEQITPQAMGVTLAGLEAKGLVQREDDPRDGRRKVMSLTDSGVEMLRDKHDTRVRQFAGALEEGFTAAELKTLAAAAPLLERLGQII